MNKTEHEKNQKAIINRMAKIIGHTKSVKTMVEDGRDCSEVLIQLSAVKAAINNTGKEVLKLYLQECLQDAVENSNPEKLRELNRIIETFMK
ncbi:MAG: metal-sensing transcriptional repressor [Lachnospiraceae bacterium]|nr:metal-sensing transcriptional repressor [Lachnospiraceae bacterium]